jgi:hypothetical protein
LTAFMHGYSAVWIVIQPSSQANSIFVRSSVSLACFASRLGAIRVLKEAKHRRHDEWVTCLDRYCSDRAIVRQFAGEFAREAAAKLAS